MITILKSMRMILILSSILFAAGWALLYIGEFANPDIWEAGALVIKIAVIGFAATALLTVPLFVATIMRRD